MKIAKNILTKLASGIVLVSTIPTLASCSKTVAAPIEAAEISVSIVGNQKYTYFAFTLNEALKDGQTLTCNAEGNDYFTFGDLVTENKLVSLPVVWICEDAVQNKILTQDIKFTCTSSSGTKLWEETIKNCTVTYSPNITLTSEREHVTQNLSKDKKTLTGTFTFELGSELESILELKPYLTKMTSGYSLDYDNTKIEVNGKIATLTVVVQRNTTIGSGDKFGFDLQIECVVTGTVWTYWQSNMFANMSISYDETEKAIPEEDLDIKGSVTTGQTLYGIKSTSKAWDANADYNTLVIPAKSATSWVRYVGGGTDVIKLPEGIKKIKIGGIGVQKFNANCFKGLNKVTYLDLSAITDTVQSLDTVLEFGDYSFSGWATEGHIIWNSTISQYKKHIVKEKLYKAGLTNNSWFGIIEVYNLSQLKEAAYTGGTIKLMDHISITPTTNFTGQINFWESCILDLNGKTIEVKERPIFNTPKAEFAVIGVWDCELLVCDSSTNHDGSIKAFDCSDVNDVEKTEAYRPENPPEDPTKDPGTNVYWEWLPDDKRWRIRENRTFYVRSDIPTRAKGTLEILGGKFYGNCTNIMNWNTTVYVEDGYVKDDEKTKETYKGTYAPEFHLYSSYCSESYAHVPTNPCQEQLNCKESTCLSGEATFQVWGGKFYGKASYDTTTKKSVLWKYFDPSVSDGDQVPDPDNPGKYKKADWTNGGKYSTIDSTHAEPDITKEVGYILAVPAQF